MLVAVGDTEFMKTPIEKRKASGIVDYFALALTTVGVGYIPGAPGTYGSAVGVLIYLFVGFVYFSVAYMTGLSGGFWAFGYVGEAVMSVLLVCLCLSGIWASGRTAPIFGNEDPSQAVIDEVMGQLITFCFVPFGLSWPFILAGFLLFRLFDIWKPFPIHTLEILPGGLGICADDIIAGVYAGVCLAIGYSIWAIYISL